MQINKLWLNPEGMQSQPCECEAFDTRNQTHRPSIRKHLVKQPLFFKTLIQSSNDEGYK